MMDTRPKQRLTDPRAAAARNIIYPALPDGHVPVVIQQHPEPNRHINPSLLISAQYAMLCSPAPYHPIAPDHPPANAKRATVDFLDQASAAPKVSINIILAQDSIAMTLNMPIIIDGYSPDDFTATINPELMHHIPRQTAVELAYLAMAEQIEEDKYDYVYQIRALQNLASMAASKAINAAIQTASKHQVS